MGPHVDHGATTLWEHWQFSDDTFSHNHPMFGSVSQWLYNWPGGIEPAPDAVAFDKFTLQPQFLKGLDWVRCTYRSVHGPVACDWKREKASVSLDLRVPVNTAATLILPIGCLENGRPLAAAKGVKRSSDRGGPAYFKLESGQYHFLFNGLITRKRQGSVAKNEYRSLARRHICGAKRSVRNMEPHARPVYRQIQSAINGAPPASSASPAWSP